MEPVDPIFAALGAAVKPAHRGGRPSVCSWERLGQMLVIIQARGLSDTAAAKLVGISGPTIGRLKRASPPIASLLENARGAYREALSASHGPCDPREEGPGWRAATRALLRAFPRDYSLRRRLDPEE